MRSVLVDTSVWVAHFRQHNDQLAQLLVGDQVMGHPLIVGEIACGTPPDRVRTLADLGCLQPVRQASLQETMAFVERENLFGLGCGLVDFLLLASVMMTPGVALWTLDKRLCALAGRFGVVHPLGAH